MGRRLRAARRARTRSRSGTATMTTGTTTITDMITAHAKRATIITITTATRTSSMSCHAGEAGVADPGHRAASPAPRAAAAAAVLVFSDWESKPARRRDRQTRRQTAPPAAQDGNGRFPLEIGGARHLPRIRILRTRSAAHPRRGEVVKPAGSRISTSRTSTTRRSPRSASPSTGRPRRQAAQRLDQRAAAHQGRRHLPDEGRAGGQGHEQAPRLPGRAHALLTPSSTANGTPGRAQPGPVARGAVQHARLHRGKNLERSGR
jgi:hypothetical protein